MRFLTTGMHLAGLAALVAGFPMRQPVRRHGKRNMCNAEKQLIRNSKARDKKQHRLKGLRP